MTLQLSDLHPARYIWCTSHLLCIFSVHTHTLVFLLNGSVDSIHIICTLSCDTSTWNRRELLGNTSLCVFGGYILSFREKKKKKRLKACTVCVQVKIETKATEQRVMSCHTSYQHISVFFHNPFRLQVKRNVCTASILSPLIRTQLLTAANACWCYKAHTFNPSSLTGTTTLNL